MKDHPEKERSLWKIFDRITFESDVALSGVSSDEVLKLIDYPEYFKMSLQPLPDNRSAILERLAAEHIINSTGINYYDITNFGALLFAENLQKFPGLARKALRVILYQGRNRIETKREQSGIKGYAVGFKGAIKFITDQLPYKEKIFNGIRQSIPVLPELAIRELVANALIHQDFSISGTGPMVEMFEDRLEITNPGTPLVDTQRFIDCPPRSRNEKIAAFMRIGRAGIVRCSWMDGRRFDRSGNCQSKCEATTQMLHNIPSVGLERIFGLCQQANATDHRKSQ